MLKQLLAMAVLAATPAVVLSPATPAMARQESKRLTIGDAAPALPPVNWILGEPIKGWEKGKIYVLDFWATWCGPCIAAMPHMNEVSKKYADKGVSVIGLAVWPREKQVPTRQWVEKRQSDDKPGNDIVYLIADDIDGKVANAYPEAAGINSIPHIIIIDREGRIAWKGHPMDGMDEVLEKIVAGSYDVSKAAEEAKAKAEREQLGLKLMNEFQTAQMGGDWVKLVEIADKMLETDPEGLWQAGLYKYFVLVTKVSDHERAGKAGAELADKYFAKNSQALYALSAMIGEEEQIADDKRDLDLALRAATKANELEEGKIPEILASLARIHSRKKDHAAAIEWQTKAIDAAKDNPELTAQLEERLAEYKKAAEGG